MKKNLEYAIVVTCLLLVLACKNDPSGKPDLSRNEIVPIIYELMLVDELSLQRKGIDSTVKIDSFRSVRYAQVFELNKTNFETFKESYEYYLARPDQMKLIVDSVESLSNRKRIEKMVPSTAPPANRDTSGKKKPA